MKPRSHASARAAPLIALGAAILILTAGAEIVGEIRAWLAGGGDRGRAS